MASAAQMKALLNSHITGDDEYFYAITLQVAATEAKQGHEKLAQELVHLVDEAKKNRDRRLTIPLNRPQGDLAEILSVSYPQVGLTDMVLSKQLDNQLKRILIEQRKASRIQEHGLSPRRKIILVGPPGTGKTMTASVLAGELSIPLFQVRLDGLITKFMGETASKLRLIFEATEQTRGVYFFDEFDAIGSERGLANDVGEIRRILNSFLQMIEQDNSDSLIIAATNHPEILDYALFRRFDDVLKYELPDVQGIKELLKDRLCNYTDKGFSWDKAAEIARGLSHAEITRATQEVIKDSLINDLASVSENEILNALNERHEIKERLKSLS
jgi:SpoVK/Ycf46/Vps4 family AAA+-type ATPase